MLYLSQRKIGHDLEPFQNASCRKEEKNLGCSIVEFVVGPSSNVSPDVLRAYAQF